MATIDDVIQTLKDIKDLITWLPERLRVASNQIVVTSLSEISETLGTIRAGEFRSGNGRDPGQGFSGVRIGYPPFIYDNSEYNLVGISDDELQAGISAEDGKLYAAEGRMIIDRLGLASINKTTEVADDNPAYGSTNERHPVIGT